MRLATLVIIVAPVALRSQGWLLFVVLWAFPMRGARVLEPCLVCHRPTMPL